MRILIDAVQQANHVTGTDRLARNVLVELQKIDRENTYYILSSSEYKYVSSCIHADNFIVTHRPKRSRPTRVLLRSWQYLNSLVPGYGRNVDISMSFHNMSLVDGVNSARIVCAYDLIPLLMQDSYLASRAELYYYQLNLKRTSRSADRFLAISNHTKNDLQAHLNIDPKKISVISLAADERFSDHISDMHKRVISEKYNLPDEFVLALGANEPRKNIKHLIAAHKLLPKTLQRKYPLIIVGKEWRSISFEHHLGKYIRYIGYVSDADLPAVYALATVFVYPSLHEGFGLPILESMTCGTPVITSLSTATQEASNDAAILVDPTRPHEIAEQLQSVLEDTYLQRKLINDGRARVQQMSWYNTAMQIYQEFAKVTKS